MKTINLTGYFLIIAAISMILSCSGEGEKAPSNNPQPPADTTGTSSQNPSQNTDTQDKVFSNPMEYVISIDSLRTWGLLCQYSKWGQELRGGNYTLLCPKINLLKNKGKEILVALKDKKNADILNDLIAAHILKTDVSVDKWKYDDVFETIDGRQYKVGGQVIQDVVYFTYNIHTKHGSVVITEFPIEFPDKELRARISAK
ncbi:MAG: fasciclin domain-containing protein [Flavobacteriales bacterium]